MQLSHVGGPRCQLFGLLEVRAAKALHVSCSLRHAGMLSPAASSWRGCASVLMEREAHNVVRSLDRMLDSSAESIVAGGRELDTPNARNEMKV